MSEKIFEKIKELLSTQNADFRAVSHASAKTSAEVAVARGTELGQVFPQRLSAHACIMSHLIEIIIAEILWKS